MQRRTEVHPLGPRECQGKESVVNRGFPSKEGRDSNLLSHSLDLPGENILLQDIKIAPR